MTFLVAGAASCAIAASAMAETYNVEINGFVEYNQVGFGSFGDVNPGDAATYSFQIDSTDFMNSDSFNTRGYAINPDSFNLTMGSVSMGLDLPFADTPYFVLRNDDPGVDGFFLTHGGVDWPAGLALEEPGGIAPNFEAMFPVGYEGDTLDSLNIEDAAGEYTFDGLTNFYFVILDGPFEPIGMIFDSMTITTVPAPATAIALLPFLAGARRRRS